MPSIPSELDQLIAKMMNRFPASRPTAVQVGRELAKFGDPIQLLPSELGHSLSPEDATVMLGTSENGRLRTAVSHLTQLITTKTASVQDAARAVLTALSETARFSGELPAQQKRLQEYVRALSGALCRTSGWTQFSDSNYLEELLQCIPCRNIGFVAIPAQFLTKANPTQNEEREIEKHTIYGCEILEALRKKHAESLGFLRTAHAVVRSHHERWDGSGFPDGLIRDQIPHAARLIALAEGYDMLRGDLVDGTPGLSHEEAVEGLAQEARSMFDPEVVEAFIKCNHKFEEIYRLTADGGNSKVR